MFGNLLDSARKVAVGRRLGDDLGSAFVVGYQVGGLDVAFKGTAVDFVAERVVDLYHIDFDVSSIFELFFCSLRLFFGVALFQLIILKLLVLDELFLGILLTLYRLNLWFYDIGSDERVSAVWFFLAG